MGCVYGGRPFPKVAAATAAVAPQCLNCSVATVWPTSRPAFLWQVVNAVALGFLDNATVDKSLKRVLAMRHRLQMYDPPNQTAYHALDPAKIRDSAAHRALALDAAKAAVSQVLVI